MGKYLDMIRCECGALLDGDGNCPSNLCRLFGPSSKHTILDDAATLTSGQRREDYGGVRESFTQIAALWSPILGVSVTPEQVALCLIQLKVSRYSHGKTRDSIVDIAGYARCLEMLADETA